MNALILACCGAVFSLTFPPIGLWFLLLALVPLFLLCAQSESAKASFWYGFAFAVGFFSLHILWLPQSFSASFGNGFWATYPPILAVLGVMWGLVTWLSRFLGGRSGVTLALLPALWVLMEWARAQGIFAFPWGQLGYMWLHTPLAQLADIQGVYGLSFFTAVLTSLIALPFLPQRRPDYGFDKRRGFNWLPLGAVAVLLVLAFFYSSNRVQTIVQRLKPEHKALLVQGATDPFGRNVGESDDFTVYNRLTSSATAKDTVLEGLDLIIWPEGALLDPIIGTEAGQQQRDILMQSSQSVPIITGGSGPSEEANRASYNSVYSIVDASILDRFDKMILVPFGEVFPLYNQLSWIYNPIFRAFGLPPQAGRSYGQDVHALKTPLGKVAAYICYESVIPKIPRDMVKEGAQVLINISNDAWFSHGNGAAQHFAMGSMRAIESRRYLLRVGNDGITALVNPLGQAKPRLERGVSDSLAVEFAMLEQETLYVRYGDIWLIILLVYAALAAVVGLLARNDD